MCLTASFLATGGFKFFILFQNACLVCKHAYLNTLLFLHCGVMLCMVKMLLKEEDGDAALNSRGNYIVDHVKSSESHRIVFLNSCGNPVPCPYYM